MLLTSVKFLSSVCVFQLVVPCETNVRIRNLKFSDPTVAIQRIFRAEYRLVVVGSEYSRRPRNEEPGIPTQKCGLLHEILVLIDAIVRK
jgi:hypothetical protein